MSREREDLENGLVQVTIIKTGWFLVEIGRARYTKRFNLAYNEASQLRDLLDNELSAPAHPQGASTGRGTRES